jgi:hypothetical protein
LQKLIMIARAVLSHPGRSQGSTLPVCAAAVPPSPSGGGCWLSHLP